MFTLLRRLTPFENDSQKGKIQLCNHCVGALSENGNFSYISDSLPEGVNRVYSGFVPMSLSSQFFSQSRFQKRKANALTELLRDGEGG